MSGIDALRSLAQKFDPQKLASLLSSQNAGLITAGRCGVWVCPEFKNMIQICRGVIQGEYFTPTSILNILWNENFKHFVKWEFSLKFWVSERWLYRHYCLRSFLRKQGIIIYHEIHVLCLIKWSFQDIYGR